jgi:hypothetical protein
MKEQPKSTLFLIRLWADEPVPGAHWQGRIQPIGEGRATTFTDWPTLQQLLEAMLLNPQQDDRSDCDGAERRQDDELPLHYYPTSFQ